MALNDLERFSHDSWCGQFDITWKAPGASSFSVTSVNPEASLKSVRFNVKVGAHVGVAG